MIDNLNILYVLYSKQISKVKKLSRIMDMHYSVTSVVDNEVTSVIDSKVTSNTYSQYKESMLLYGQLKKKEYKDKIEYDCELIKFQVTTQQLIEEYKVFHDETKKELSPDQYNRIKKLADGTLLETKIHAQKES